MKRYAICSALAASAIPSLVLARGHRISQVPEIPLVIAPESIASINKTKKAVEVLKKIHAYEDIEKVINSRKLRAGVGKMRNRRHTQRRGPLVVYKEHGTFLNAIRNIPGVEMVCVDRLNLLTLAPGGHLGRFIIWTKDAFASLDALYGTTKKMSTLKSNYRLPRSTMSNPDLGRIINSEEIQSVLRPKRKPRFYRLKRNPLRNKNAMAKLNPYSVIVRRHNLLALRKKEKESLIKKGKLTPRPRKEKPKKVPKEGKAKAPVVKKEATKKRKAPKAPKDPKKVLALKKKARKTFVASLFA
jgi:large subunit ribosomal protein L4e